MKLIMILGASILQLPAIQKAKEMGLQVIAVDMDKNAIGFKYADICLEVSTIDIPSVIEAAKKYKIDGIMTLASDMPMRTVAAISKEMGLIGITEDTAIKTTNKAVMRQCLKENKVPIPAFYKAITKEQYLKVLGNFESKCIVKPADNSGSRGVFFIKNISDKDLIDYAFEYSKKYSRNGEIIVESFMEGYEVSVETLSIEGKVYVIQITDKLTTGGPRFVEMGHSQPSQLPNEIKKQIMIVAANAVKAVGIVNGPSHTEMMVTKEGIKIIELGARLGGDCITTHLVPLSTGVDMVKCCIQIALGDRPDIKSKFSKGAAIQYFETKTGKITSIAGVDEASKLPGVKEISFVKHIGDITDGIYSSSDRIGFVIAQANDTQKAIAICKSAIKNITIQLEDIK
jgi:biotin carboxylase